MRGHRQAFPTPRGRGNHDRNGGVSRLPDVVPRRFQIAGNPLADLFFVLEFSVQGCLGLELEVAYFPFEGVFHIPQFAQPPDLVELITDGIPQIVCRPLELGDHFSHGAGQLG